jgi:hypothetical protein
MGKTVWFELPLPGDESTREMSEEELLSLF